MTSQPLEQPAKKERGAAGAPTPPAPCVKWGPQEMEYLLLKQVHVACAVLSYAGFFARGVWMMRGSAMLSRRSVKILPHVNDTLLLASAIAMAAIGRQYPFVQGWLTAKVLALVFYIVLGILALRPGRALPLRIAAWLAAQAVFIYIVWVAITRNPSPWTG